MKMTSKWLVLLTLVGFCVACGDDATQSEDSKNNDSNSTISDRGGPQSLSGFDWSTGPIDANGFQLELAFEFGEDELTASNTCEGTTTVTTTSPIRYTYQAEVATGNSDVVEDGEDFCEVSIDAGSFDFEIVEGNLQMTTGGETVVVSPAGSVSGLYGEWSVGNEVGTLYFSMGNGRLEARSECTNGLVAKTSVAANYRNFVVIEEASMGGDDLCSVSIDASTMEYRFEGSELVLIQDGQEIRLSK